MYPTLQIRSVKSLPMQKNCSKCGMNTNDNRDLHCRRIFINEIKTLLSFNETEKAKSLYYSESFDEKWKALFLSNLGGVLESLVINDRQKEEDRKIKEVKVRHQEFLNSLGVNYLGIISIDTTGKHRATHCYNCKENLDNNINIECNACHWIICECGACGCGYW